MSMLYDMLSDLECDENGIPTLEILESAREMIFDDDLLIELENIEMQIEEERDEN